jgi:hypothetical protein
LSLTVATANALGLTRRYIKSKRLSGRSARMHTVSMPPEQYQSSRLYCRLAHGASKEVPLE